MTDHTTLLGSLNLFESLSVEELAALSSRLEEVDVAAGKIIFKQGEPGGRLFIIQAGAVDISYGIGKEFVTLATLVPGEYFGELSLFDGEPRSATARGSRLQAARPRPRRFRRIHEQAPRRRSQNHERTRPAFAPNQRRLLEPSIA